MRASMNRVTAIVLIAAQLVFMLPPFFSAALPTLLVYVAWALMMRRVR